jgi:hypothetical protein
MADQSHRLAGIVEGLDQSDGIGAFRQVPHGPVPARVEYRVKVLYSFESSVKTPLTACKYREQAVYEVSLMADFWDSVNAFLVRQGAKLTSGNEADHNQGAMGESRSQAANAEW